MKRITLLTSMLMFILLRVNAQMGINKDGTTPHPSAMLDIKASANTNAKGLLMPRVADHTVITSPATGLMVFNTTTNTFWYYNGLAWTDMGNGGSNGAWLQNGTNVYTNNNNVGINTATPQTTLDVKGDGFLVSQKTKLTTEDPNLHQYNMPLSNVTYTDAAGILYDPSGPTAPYPSGTINTTTTISISDPNVIGIKLTFETFDTEANGDSIIIMNGAGTPIIKYSGNIIPPDFFHNASFVQIKFKTNGNSTVGQGFKIKWQRVDKDGSTAPINGLLGNNAYFETNTGGFRSGNMAFYSTETIGNNSVAIGFANRASNTYTIAMGSFNSATGTGSIAMGTQTKASGTSSTAIGFNTNSTGNYSTSMGNNSTALGNYSTSIGNFNNASGEYSTALGNRTTASGAYSTAIGSFTTASGYLSTAFGGSNNATSAYSTAMGYNTNARGNYSTSMGNGTNAYGEGGIATGNSTTANGSYTNASGGFTTANNFYSTAMGLSSSASGYASVAMGYSSNATSNSSYGTAMGYYTTASSTASFASGYQTISGGNASTAMGYYSNASGFASTALGNYANASGYNSTAIGTNSVASGFSSTAIGYGNTASGSNTTVMGNNVNANYEGSFVIGDSPNSSNTLYSQNLNSFNSRFRNGYYLYTSSNLSSGVFMFSGANSWSSISDSTKKENFQAIDGENILKKIAKMRTVTWNYKGQDPKTFRHYGLMAQEFFGAFGRDKFGTIGNDTTIASADFDGVSITAIKALEKRTQDLQIENELLKNRLKDLEKSNPEMVNLKAEKDNELLKNRVAHLEKSNTELVSLKAEIEQLKAFLLPEKEKIKVKVISDK